MPSPPSSPPARPPQVRKFYASALILPAVAAGLVIWTLWCWRQERQENRILRAELAEVRRLHRQAVSQGSAAAAATERAASLEQTLEVMKRQASADKPAGVEDSAGAAARAAELERVIEFLRGEITAAHETIERLRQDGPPAGRGE